MRTDPPAPQPDTSPEEKHPPAPQPETASGQKRRLPSIPPILLVGGIVLGLILIGLVVFLALRPVLFPPHPAGIPLEITRVSFTSPLATPPPPIVEVGDTQITLPVPVTLEVGDHSFPVQPTGPGEGAWADPSAYPGFAIWVHGTVVNYVLGLEATEDNRAVVAGLRSGDPLSLHLSNGTRLIFHFVEQTEVSPDDATLFDQSHPGLTLVLLGEEETERTVAFADFDRAEEPTLPTGGPAAGVGQAVQVGDARVTVIEGHAGAGGGDLPPGTMTYLVEFSVSNTGQSPLDVEEFVMELVDGVGNRYLHSPSIAAQGQYGPLEGEVAADAEVNGTAGYIVPDGLIGPTLTWVFGPQPGSELRARFTIPYTPPAVSPTWAVVEVLQAFLGEGNEALHVVAEVQNTGTSPLTVTANDIRLSSSAGPGELQVAAPPFPWTIEGGESREVELQFARPQASSCVVTILGYTFEISGLP